MLVVVAIIVYGQDITEENYRKFDNELWNTHQQQVDSLSVLMERFPEKEDSLMQAYNKMKSAVDQQNINAAIKYASVPSGLQRLYWVRLDLPKDTVQTIWNNLSDEMKNSPYGKSLKLHLETEQIKEGDRYY